MAGFQRCYNAIMIPIEPGTRPLSLVKEMTDSSLRHRLLQCAGGPFIKTDFCIGHRGAALHYPEHTRESYEAAARQGAGIIECDVIFTQDRQLVCRHSQCDLHRTTNILAIPELAAKCSIPFAPAVTDPVTGAILAPARARCCTSDITMAEFRTLRGRMDVVNPNATTVTDYLRVADCREDGAQPSGTVMTHAESIELLRSLGVKMIPELKTPAVAMPYGGVTGARDYTQQRYAQQLIDEYRNAGVQPDDVFLQSFSLDDIRYWLAQEPAYARQAMWLDGRYRQPAFDHRDPATWQPGMAELASLGIRIIAPPIWMLLSLEQGRIVPSVYARAARAAGLSIIAWTLERRGPGQDNQDWYYQTIRAALPREGDVMAMLDVLAQDVGVMGVFSDWPATVTYYANCMKL